MKKLLLIAVILFTGLSLFAQETTIDKAEFDKVMGASFRVLMNQPHRTTEESVSESSFGTSTIRTITERFGTTYRSVFEADSAASSMKTENIFINGKQFQRNGNSPWAEVFSGPKPTSSNEWETVSDEKAYKSLGESTMDGKKVNVYKTVSATTRINKVKGGGYAVSEATTYYFDGTGLMIKSESVTEQTNKPKVEAGSAFVPKETKTITKRVKTVEIDPKIKIEAPQIG